MRVYGSSFEAQVRLLPVIINAIELAMMGFEP